MRIGIQKLTRGTGPVLSTPVLPRAAFATNPRKSHSDLAQEAVSDRFGETCFLADWVDLVFLHFRID